MNTVQPFQILFKSFTSGNLILQNRIVMAPMSRGGYRGGVSEVATYYRHRVENGVGLIVTEGTFINHPEAAQIRNSKGPNFYGEEALIGWSKVVSEVHEAGGKIMPQLWHMGSKHSVTELTEAEIAEIIEAYEQAAGDAKRLGFDGIELHGAHGYTIDQFFWKKTNQRIDRYGGDIVARTRFAVEVIEACRRAVGKDFPIILRMSQWKTEDEKAKLFETPEQLSQFLPPLVEAGVNIFHCSALRFWEPEFDGSDLNLAGWIKKLSGKPTITVGAVGTVASDSTRFGRLVEMLEEEEIDLVAVGRPLLADPAWVAKVRDGKLNELKSFSPLSFISNK